MPNNNIKKYQVRDHCYYTGKYRGAAHNACHLNYKESKEIPISFHMMIILLSNN